MPFPVFKHSDLDPRHLDGKIATRYLGLPTFAQNPFVMQIGFFPQVAERRMGKVELTGAKVPIRRLGGLDRIPRQAKDGGLEPELALPFLFLQVSDPVPPLDPIRPVRTVVRRKNGHVIRSGHQVPFGRSGWRLDPFGLQNQR